MAGAANAAGKFSAERVLAVIYEMMKGVFDDGISVSLGLLRKQAGRRL